MAGTRMGIRTKDIRMTCENDENEARRDVSDVGILSTLRKSQKEVELGKGI